MSQLAQADALQECVGLSAPDLASVLDLLAGSDIAELDVRFQGTRLSLRRPPGPQSPAVASAAPAEPTSLTIASPLVGIFRPAVKTGDTVQVGESIGAIEALGMPASVDAPQGGTVEELLVAAGSPVEYGQPLLTLRRV